MRKRLSILFVIGFIVLLATVGFILMGTLPAIIFSVGTVGGFILWLATTYRTPIEPNKVIIPYLFTIVLFIIHVYEEYVTDFEVAITDITWFHVLEKNFLTIVAFIGPSLWLIGAILY